MRWAAASKAVVVEVAADKASAKGIEIIATTDGAVAINADADSVVAEAVEAAARINNSAVSHAHRSHR